MSPKKKNWKKKKNRKKKIKKKKNTNNIIIIKILSVKRDIQKKKKCKGLIEHKDKNIAWTNILH